MSMKLRNADLILDLTPGDTMPGNKTFLFDTYAQMLQSAATQNSLAIVSKDPNSALNGRYDVLKDNPRIDSDVQKKSDGDEIKVWATNTGYPVETIILDPNNDMEAYLVVKNYVSGATVGADLAAGNIQPLSRSALVRWTVDAVYHKNQLVMDSNGVPYLVLGKYTSSSSSIEEDILANHIVRFPAKDEWKTGHHYKDGDVIYSNHNLYIAQKDFVGGATLDADLLAMNIKLSSGEKQVKMYTVGDRYKTDDLIIDVGTLTMYIADQDFTANVSVADDLSKSNMAMLTTRQRVREFNVTEVYKALDIIIDPSTNIPYLALQDFTGSATIDLELILGHVQLLGRSVIMASTPGDLPTPAHADANAIYVIAQDHLGQPYNRAVRLDGGKFINVGSLNTVKNLLVDPRPADAYVGDISATTQTDAKQISIFDGAAWQDLFDEIKIKEWIAAGSLFQGALAEAVAGGAIDFPQLPAPDPTNRGQYWVWSGSPNYAVDTTTPVIGADLDGRTLQIGDWIQSNGTNWIHIAGDLLNKARGDKLYGLLPWADGNWERGALVHFDKGIFRAKVVIQAGDVDPTDPASKWEKLDLKANLVTLPDDTGLPLVGDDETLYFVSVSALENGEHAMYHYENGAWENILKSDGGENKQYFQPDASDLPVKGEFPGQLAFLIETITNRHGVKITTSELMKFADVNGKWIDVKGGAGGGGTIGAVEAFPMMTPPVGYLYCDGSLIPTKFTELISLIGSHLPDLRGQFLRGATKSTNMTNFPKIVWTTGIPKDPFRTDPSGAHAHGIHRGGDHNHIYQYESAGQVGGGADGTGAGRYFGFASKATQNAGTHSHSMSQAAAHQHNMAGGDPETAPDHVNMFFHIRAIGDLVALGTPGTTPNPKITTINDGDPIPTTNLRNGDILITRSATDDLQSLKIYNGHKWSNYVGQSNYFVTQTAAGGIPPNAPTPTNPGDALITRNGAGNPFMIGFSIDGSTWNVIEPSRNALDINGRGLPAKADYHMQEAVFFDTAGAHIIRVADRHLDWQPLAQASAGSVPIGTIIDHVSMNPIPGYLPCNGTAIDQTLYPILHGLCGGVTPNLIWQFTRGAPNQAKIDGFAKIRWITGKPRNNAFGGTTIGGGRHSHTTAVRDAGVGGGPFGGVGGGSYFGMNNMPSNVIGDHMHNFTITTGGDAETAPDHTYVAKHIKTD